MPESFRVQDHATRKLRVASLNGIVQWIVSALYGGYTASNLLKWYWWRFNGYGYFWGMIVGVCGAIPMVVPAYAEKILGPNANPILIFPALAVLSLIGCVAGTLMTKPEDDAILKNFYKTVNPWGWWGPIRAKVMRDDPAFRPNRNAARDLTNVAVGIVWQLCLVTSAIYLVLQQWTTASAILGLLALTSIYLKFSWYDRLEKA